MSARPFASSAFGAFFASRGVWRVVALLALVAVLAWLGVSPSEIASAAPPKAAPKANGYAHSVQTWHTPPPGRVAPHDDAGRALLALSALNTNEHVELSPLTDSGSFNDAALDRLATFAREPSSGQKHPMHPRLVDLIYRIQTQFVAVEIRLLSGFRAPHGGRLSNHGRGRAMDIIVPGHGDEEVARFVREQGFVGVGVYPTSGFIHVDVRDRSYFWIDASGPGKRNRERGILHDVAQRADARALARGDHPVEPYDLDFDVDHAASRIDAGALHADPDEDDLMEGDGT